MAHGQGLCSVGLLKAEDYFPACLHPVAAEITSAWMMARARLAVCLVTKFIFVLVYELPAS